MEIVTQIDITASPERVWAVLARFEDYPRWNPLVTEAVGELREGGRIAVRLEMEGGKRVLRIRPRLLKVAPARELRWRGTLPIPGLFSGEHAFLLEPHAGGTRFTHRERFRGLLLPFLRGMLRRGAQPGFENMNRALKHRVEAGASS